MGHLATRESRNQLRLEEYMAFENCNIPNTLLSVIMIGVHHSSSAKQPPDNMFPQSGCIRDSVRPVISFFKTKQSLLNQQLSFGATED